jgi:NAD dependent epimerase/dehydratase
MTWKGRRVLVTGADGFIGSHLAEALACAGARVRVFCLYNSNGSLGWLDTTEPGLRSTFDVALGDIRDQRFVERACRDVEVIFHLAALIAIPYSYQAPESFVDTNVKGTLNVLEAARICGAQRMVHASTSEVYGSPDTVPIVESHALKGQSPYSASKIAADKLCEAFASSFGTPVTVLRPFNTYGPRQSPRAVIPSILRQLIAGRRRILLGSLWPKRDFTFVGDTVAGFILAGASPLPAGEVIQLGTGVAVSIQELFDCACGLLGVEAEAVTDQQRTRPDRSEVAVLQSDPSRARQRLGWAARVALEEGLGLTADWIRAHGKLEELDRYFV